MTLTAGTKLGPYEIVAPLGAGGMGEVYRARDTRLQRDVAIKVLPAEVSGDPVRRQRFELEARAIAALSHPHICAIHDIGAVDATDFLVLELIEGETLAARLKRGPLPLPEALARANEIADAVAAAHRRNIIHRDLKPGNVMLTKSGAKVMDFGLARIVRDEPAVTSDATVTAPLTEVGVVLGTLQYMAPEQIEGRPADARTDIFSFGAMFYEMLTGKRAFEASSAAGLMGAILRADAPTASSVRPGLPANVDRLIRSCLAKDPNDRLASMHDVALALGWTQRDLDAGQDRRVAPATRSRPTATWLAIAALLILGVGVAGGYWFARRSTNTPAPRARYVYDIPLPPGTRHWNGLALSPDGKRLALVTQPTAAVVTPDPRLWIRSLDSAGDWQLVSGAGPEIPQFPFWSPNGRSLAFFVTSSADPGVSDGKLVRVDLPSLTIVPICAAESGRGGAWLDDDTIVFAPTFQGGLQRVNSGGGTPFPFVDKQPSDSSLRFPSSIGGGQLIYFATSAKAEQGEIRLLRTDDPQHPKSVVATTAVGTYDNGTLFYVRDHVWIAQHLNVETARLEGDAVPVPLDYPAGGTIGEHVSAHASIVAVENVQPAAVQPTWFDRGGTAIGKIGEAAVQNNPDISRDGGRVVLERTALHETASTLWIVDIATNGSRRLTAKTGSNPVWNPSGTRIAFRSSESPGGTFSLYEAAADGSGAPQLMLGGFSNMFPRSWTTDGGLVFTNTGLPGATQPLPLGVLIRQPDGKVGPYRATGPDGDARLSPSGSRIAILTHETGELTLLVDSFPTPSGHPALVAHGPVGNPQWSGDGRELYFAQDNHLMAAPVSEGALTIGTPVRLFDLPSRTFAVDPVAKRFLVLVPVSEAASSIKVIVNWQ
ncbi:MAG TPA: protein kinase [Vicinamibacterales bacterium]|nr:protein kinase [Vicinamibacterales bacterium]